ncbi:hypothetical protein [Paenibacillus sp. B2(2019)]|uniref:hypothetical protein n=1 Tax=Paenibacillus sp. B2(2019) TaxID=2607754 RepID=UPI0011F37508|nr:hypothetical protein [Paenibacillus sp. B2(2019)]KAA1180672.1 hypothetical protein PAENI_25820 [Paenibacillus sp. B2(2019)]
MSEGKVALLVTIARLPEEAIIELDERIGELLREVNIDHDNDELISDDMMSTFNLLTIGYDAAWTEVERLSEALAGMHKERNKVLAALEESQQQVKTLKTEKALLEGELGQAEAYKHFEAERTKEAQSINRQLAEAQQTISRQREALEYYAHVYVAHERLEEWDNGKRARAALEGAQS